MAEITKIEPKGRPVRKLKKVAAYARVSMDTERLEHSLSAQVSYYSNLIQKNPEWVYAGVYSDNGISGTKTEKRHGFQEMVKDADDGKIDIILTKSISRFARNTVDLLETVRHLKNIGVEVRFEKEHINSLSSDGELMLSILASFAQEESRSISDNVKWGTRKRFEQGIPNGKFRIYGYRWEGDQLIVIPEEAAIVKRIFQNFLDGKSRLETEKEFAAEGITTRQGCRWVDSNIKQVLTNITYTGNMLFQKEFISDPIEKRRMKNYGELPQYYVEGTHEAIIDMDTFRYVQDEIARRKELGALANKSLNITCFTGKIKCPYCRISYVHCTSHRKDGRTENYWKCGSTKKKGGRCPTKGTIVDKKLREACARAMGIPEFDEDKFAELIDHIEVTARYTVVIFMKDGRQINEKCIPTGHQDCWTDELRKKTSKKRLMNPCCAYRSVFTGKIWCRTCGGRFRAQSQKLVDGRDTRYWRCQSAAKCTATTLRDDRLKELLADALGTKEFDEEIFKELVDHIEVDDTKVYFIFNDGHEESRVWTCKRVTHPWTEERRKHYMETRKAHPISDEQRKKMSERMKQIRKERGRNWRKQ